MARVIVIVVAYFGLAILNLVYLRAQLKGEGCERKARMAMNIIAVLLCTLAGILLLIIL